MDLDTDNVFVDIDDVLEFIGEDVEEPEEGEAEDPENYNIIVGFVNDACVGYNRECNRLIKQRSHTEYHDGDSGRVLYLRNPPVESVTLYIDYDREFETAVDSGDYIVYPASGRIELLSDRFVRGPQTVKAVYTGGWEDSPADLIEAAMIRIARLYRLWKSGAWGTSSRSDDKGGATTYQHDLHPIETRAIRKYKIEATA